MVERESNDEYCRYYQLAGITIRVESDLPMTDTTFLPKFEPFRVQGPGEDNIVIRHHPSLPEYKNWDMGEKLYREPPWEIYRKDDSWIYMGIMPDGDERIWRIAVFSKDHTQADIYSPTKYIFPYGRLLSLTSFPTDQILFGRLLALREGCYLHSSGVILDGKGMLFVGHSEAGKTTMATMLTGKSEILCDDRNIIRRFSDGFKVYGTWSHGDMSTVSSSSAPLKAIMFLEQAKENRLISFSDKQQITRRILACLIKPLVTAEWWKSMLDLVDKIVQEVPCYTLRFDKSGAVVDVLKSL